VYNTAEFLGGGTVHMIDYQNTPAPQPKKSGGSPLMAIISGVLVIALIAVGVLYFTQTGKLNTANADIKDLEANVASLTDQLNTEKANVTDLTAKLADETAKATDLQTQLDTAKGDLNTANGKILSLTTDLATANANATKLTADLATANAKVTSTQTSLDKANTDLATAVALTNSQAAELKKVKDPQFFASLTDLQNWLAKDDSMTNPSYASYSGVTKCFIRQIKALRDGYLLPTYLDWDTAGYYYYANTTMINGIIYTVNPSTNAIYNSPWTIQNPPPPHPLPLP
jgi:hypothetical protein